MNNLGTLEPRLGPRMPPNWEAEGFEQLDKIVKHVTQQREKVMHYRNGREAKNGDKIIQLDMGSEGRIVAFGVLHSATPGNDYCNGSIAPVQEMKVGACMCDCLHIEDLAALLKEKGLDKRPVGK